MDALTCNNEQDRQQSKARFLAVSTFAEFLDLWQQFYANQVCVPSTYSAFVGAEDNPQATFEVGRLFQVITRNGLIPLESQEMIPGTQKAYLVAVGPLIDASLLCTELNRFNNITALWSPLDTNVDSVNGWYVTYDSSLPDGSTQLAEMAAEKKYMLGDPFTQMSVGVGDEVEFITEWLSDDMRDVFRGLDLVKVNVVNSSFDTEQQYLLKVVAKAQENAELFKRVMRALMRGEVRDVEDLLEQYPFVHLNQHYAGRTSLQLVIENRSDAQKDLINLLLQRQDVDVIRTYDNVDWSNVDSDVHQMVFDALPEWRKKLLADQ